jgi:hypothetical protein
LTEYFQSQVTYDDLSLPEAEFTPIPRPTPEPSDPEEEIYDTIQVDESVEETFKGAPVPLQTDSSEAEEVTPIVTQTPDPTEDE